MNREDAFRLAPSSMLSDAAITAWRSAVQAQLRGGWDLTELRRALRLMCRDVASRELPLDVLRTSLRTTCQLLLAESEGPCARHGDILLDWLDSACAEEYARSRGRTRLAVAARQRAPRSDDEQPLT